MSSLHAFPASQLDPSQTVDKMQLHLEAGINSLAITAPGSSYAPDFDSINVPAPTTQYLADGAVLSGSQIAVAARTVCTDGKCVTNVGNGNSLTFKIVNAGAPGKTKVIFLYLTGVERLADILVNGSKPLTINFPATGSDPGDFTKVGAITIELPLSAGKNSITIANQHAPAPPMARPLRLILKGRDCSIDTAYYGGIILP